VNRKGIDVERTSTFQKTLLAVLAGSALSVACGAGPSGFPEVDGWTQTGEVRVYNPETLWEYINGGAVAFVEYGLRTCTTADMVADGVSITVDLYDMGSPLGAVGMFKSESDEDETDIAGATVAALSPPYQARLVKGSTYAKVNVYEGGFDEPAGHQFLQGLAASLPGDAEMPEEFSLLPEAGKVVGSEMYQPGSILGLEELPDCVYADYEADDGETWLGFVVLPSLADSVWGGLGDRWQSIELNGRTARFREVPYSGLVGVTRTESGMFGVSGATDENELRERLADFAGLERPSR
jgi:hypothetical protein